MTRLSLYSIILWLFFSCSKPSSREIEAEISRYIVDTLNFGCMDNATKFYFKGNLRGKPICYGNYTEKPETGQYFGYTEIRKILSGVDTKTAIDKGNYIGVGFKQEQIYTNLNVLHSFWVETPIFKKDVTKSYDYYLDSLIKLGNLKLRDFKTRDIYADFRVYIYVWMKGVDVKGENLVIELACDHGMQKANNYIVCKQITKISTKRYLLKFDINCELFKNDDLQYFGNLNGELYTSLNIPN